ncbi:hypothetical protein BKA64DRAFT_132835 [Cadophora sp. MPI-SDFR-AT-0126]|nr:hypothetical protein BKA64DRAFT_132835 [Leotiomycetes sp. MPI-SDFR-AT-0126]
MLVSGLFSLVFRYGMDRVRILEGRGDMYGCVAEVWFDCSGTFNPSFLSFFLHRFGVVISRSLSLAMIGRTGVNQSNLGSTVSHIPSVPLVHDQLYTVSCNISRTSYESFHLGVLSHSFLIPSPNTLFSHMQTSKHPALSTKHQHQLQLRPTNPPSQAPYLNPYRIQPSPSISSPASIRIRTNGHKENSMHGWMLIYAVGRAGQKRI